MGRLGAVTAVLRTAAGLDRKQSAKLHLACRVMMPVHVRRAEHEFGERKVEKLRDLGAGPVVAGHDFFANANKHRKPEIEPKRMVGILSGQDKEGGRKAAAANANARAI